MGKYLNNLNNDYLPNHGKINVYIVNIQRKKGLYESI